jgi:hypothetical protein
MQPARPLPQQRQQLWNSQLPPSPLHFPRFFFEKKNSKTSSQKKSQNALKFAKSLRIWSRESLTANKACCDELTGEGGEDSQGHKVMIHGVDENEGGSDGQRVASVETSLDSLPRYPQGRPH